MIELLSRLFPFLIVDVLNPVLFAIMVFAAASSRPVLNSTLTLAGHTLAYFAGGIIIALGLDRISERLENPTAIDFWIGGIIGAVLVWAFFQMRGAPAEASDEPEANLTPLGCIGLGATVNFLGLPFALPYFGAIDQVLKANLSTVEALTVLVSYNVIYAFPFTIVPVAVLVAGDKAKPLLERINQFLVRTSELVLPWMLLALGLWLLIDAVYYGITGRILEF